jgi:hypothetical protein
MTGLLKELPTVNTFIPARNIEYRGVVTSKELIRNFALSAGADSLRRSVIWQINPAF